MNHVEGRTPTMVRIVILLQILLGIGALAGGIGLAAAPDGRVLHMPLSMLGHSPFHDFLVPGLILAVFLGVYPLAVAYGLSKRPEWRWPNVLNPFKQVHWSWAGSLASGVILLVWIIVEVIMLRSAAWVHYLYLLLGLAIILVTSAVKGHYLGR
jgi:hypothetical protein